MSKTNKSVRKRKAGNPPVLLAIGDSIVWGQGLLKDDKFCYMLAEYLRTQNPALKDLQVHNRAHSGATVLCGSGPDDVITEPGYFSPVDPVSGDEAATGEVPRSKPTIL